MAVRPGTLFKGPKNRHLRSALGHGHAERQISTAGHSHWGIFWPVATREKGATDRSMPDRRSQLSKNALLLVRVPSFGARPTIRRFSNAWFLSLKQPPGPD